MKNAIARSSVRLARRAAIVLALLAVPLALPAHAHFIWISLLASGSEGEGRVEILFGDGVYEDSDPNLVRYIEGLEAWGEGGTPVVLQSHAWGLATTVGSDVALLGAKHTLGIFTPPRGGENRWLEYYAKGARDLTAAGRAAGLETEVFAVAEGEELVLRVLFQGKPAAEAEIKVWGLGSTQEVTLTADETGSARLPLPRTGGLQVRGRVIVPQSGEADGKEYTTIQHYSTLAIGTLREAGMPASASVDAYQRLEYASACHERAAIGLAGTLKVNVDGETHRGEFEHSDEGFSFEMRGAPASAVETVSNAVRDMLERSWAPRFDTGYGRHGMTLTPRDGHPLGRRIDVDDAAKTAVRVHEHELRSVERTVGDTRVVHQVLDYEETEAGRLLPRHFTVHYVDAKTGALERSEVYSDEYDLKDGALLPRARRVTIQSGEGSSVVTVRFLTVEVL